MSLYHNITVFFITEAEKAQFLQAGVTFASITKGLRGEAASFNIGEDDPKWKSVAALVNSLEGEYRSQDLTMTHPTFEETAKASLERISKAHPGWLPGYSGQTFDELIALEAEYRIDSLVAAFEQAIQQKVERNGDQSLTAEERIVLAVEALEREVNNGGYDQFFVNAPSYASIIVSALQTIGCERTAIITGKAIKALGASELTIEGVENAIYSDRAKRREEFKICDNAYYDDSEPIAEKLFGFIKVNRSAIKL
jgi:hypothetical protein